METKTIVRSILAALGIVTGGYVAMKIAKYFFGATVIFLIIGLIITVKMITGAVVHVKEIEYQQSVAAIRITTDLQRTKDDLQSKDNDAQRELLLKQQLLQEQFALKQLELSAVAEQVKEKVEKAKKDEAAFEIKEKIIKYDEDTYKEYNDLKKEYDTLMGWEKVSNFDTQVKMVNRLSEVRYLMSHSIPDFYVVHASKAKIKRDVLVAYGLPQDTVIPMDGIENDPETPQWFDDY